MAALTHRTLGSPFRTRVKLCCMTGEADIHLAVAAGADAVGFVSRMPSGPGVIAEDLIGRLVQTVPPYVATVLLTAHTEAGPIVDQVRRCGTGAVQLVDAVEPGVYAALRDALPTVDVMQVIHVSGESSVAEAMAVAPFVDALLLDSGNPSLAVKELGGTGRTHDWSLSRRIAERVNVPVFLAGGLRPENVASAVTTVRPFGVDVCTGVRDRGLLNRRRLADFFAAVYSAQKVAGDRPQAMP
ncbi:MAG: N-(5'-phosphoribosyl)anthranilate isomerase [Gemmatimonadaceae bacterium]